MSPNQLIDKFPDTNILVIGDMMLDHYVWGDAHRISPEAPVPIVNVSRESYSAGGAANVALNLANLGVETAVLSYHSSDEAFTRLQQLLAVNLVHLLPAPGEAKAATIIKTRVIVRNQQLCRIDKEDVPDTYCIHNAENFFGFLNDALIRTNAVIISDYAKGVVTQPLIDFLIKAASSRGDLLVAVDPKPSNNLNFYGAGLLTPNYAEALQLAGYPDTQLRRQIPLDEICHRIYNSYAPKLLVITLGADGMALSKNGQLLQILPTEAREVFDVSGAGDTVIATLTAALASGSSLEDAALLANKAAGCVVGHMGTVPINLAELQANLHAGPLSRKDSKAPSNTN